MHKVLDTKIMVTVQNYGRQSCSLDFKILQIRVKNVVGGAVRFNDTIKGTKGDAV